MDDSPTRINIAQRCETTSYERMSLCTCVLRNCTRGPLCASMTGGLENPLMRVSAGAQSGKQFGYVVGTTRFHGDVDCSIAEIHTVVRTIVRGLDDISAVLRQNSGQAVKGAWVIRQMPSQADQTPVFYQATLHDSRE